jgi:hypothetical protein
MNRQFQTLIITLLFSITIGFAQNLDHSQWNTLLSKHVTKDGLVDYQGMKEDISDLNAYLKLLQGNIPYENWEDNEALTYWINLYNAYTVALIVRNYPVKSIMDIEKAWDKPFIILGENNYSLNDIEHKIIRLQFDEPRIHFALVCAAISCPILLNEAYDASRLEDQLQKQTVQFINDKTRNNITEKRATISQLFNWYPDDFGKNGSIADYINRYSEVQIKQNAVIEFMKYDWSLNDKSKYP